VKSRNSATMSNIACCVGQVDGRRVFGALTREGSAAAVREHLIAERKVVMSRQPACAGSLDHCRLDRGMAERQAGPRRSMPRLH
jgi:hypothetical protein